MGNFMQVQIRTLTEAPFFVEIDPSKTTVLALKQKIAQQHEIAIATQHIFFAGKPLQDSDFLPHDFRRNTLFLVYQSEIDAQSTAEIQPLSSENKMDSVLADNLPNKSSCSSFDEESAIFPNHQPITPKDVEIFTNNSSHKERPADDKAKAIKSFTEAYHASQKLPQYLTRPLYHSSSFQLACLAGIVGVGVILLGVILALALTSIISVPVAVGSAMIVVGAGLFATGVGLKARENLQREPVLMSLIWLLNSPLYLQGLVCTVYSYHVEVLCKLRLS